jgi:hypothetical protein
VLIIFIILDIIKLVFFHSYSIKEIEVTKQNNRYHNDERNGPWDSNHLTVVVTPPEHRHDFVVKTVISRTTPEGRFVTYKCKVHGCGATEVDETEQKAQTSGLHMTSYVLTVSILRNWCTSHGLRPLFGEFSFKK